MHSTRCEFLKKHSRLSSPQLIRKQGHHAHSEVKRAAAMFFQMKNLTSPICFLIVRICRKIYLFAMSLFQKLGFWGSLYKLLFQHQVFYISCVFSDSRKFYHIYEKKCQDHLKKKAQQKWTPDNLPMSIFLPFDFMYSNIAFYFLCMTGSCFYTGKQCFSTLILNCYYIGMFFLKIFRALFCLIFSAPLIAKEPAGEQFVA